jgi:ligand-binding SRPBCC domain-containing protein
LQHLKQIFEAGINCAILAGYWHELKFVCEAEHQSAQIADQTRRIRTLPKIHRLQREQIVSAGMDKVWAFFTTPTNLNIMTPPDMQFKILYGAETPMYAGQLIEYQVTFIPGLKSNWLTEITHIQERAFFIDEQRFGPYRFWHHTHHFWEQSGGTRMKDTVTYAMPFGPLGEIVHALWVHRRLRAIFDYRQTKLREIFG